MRSPILAVCVPLVAACTTLGPMPAVSGVSPVPAPRAGVELQVAAVPGYYLSSSVQRDPQGAVMPQAAAVLELGRLVGLPGLAVGGRYVGGGDDGGYPEPLIAYRLQSDFLAAAIVGGATHASGDSNQASYEATRVALELDVDARVTPESRWAELHVFATAGAHALWADGSYCLDGEGRFGVDCPESPAALTHAEASGIYPSGAVGVALEGGRHLGGIFHGVRLAAEVAGGFMPRIESGVQGEGALYGAVGLSLTVGLGAAE